MKKKLIVVLLILFGVYWLFDHADPFPLNHESFGLFNHTIHRIIGVAFFIAAGFVWWKKR